MLLCAQRLRDVVDLRLDVLAAVGLRMGVHVVDAQDEQPTFVQLVGVEQLLNVLTRTSCPERGLIFGGDTGGDGQSFASGLACDPLRELLLLALHQLGVDEVHRRLGGVFLRRIPWGLVRDRLQVFHPLVDVRGDRDCLRHQLAVRALATSPRSWVVDSWSASRELWISPSWSLIPPISLSCEFWRLDVSVTRARFRSEDAGPTAHPRGRGPICRSSCRPPARHGSCGPSTTPRRRS